MLNESIRRATLAASGGAGGVATAGLPARGARKPPADSLGPIPEDDGVAERRPVPLMRHASEGTASIADGESVHEWDGSVATPGIKPFVPGGLVARHGYRFNDVAFSYCLGGNFEPEPPPPALAPPKTRVTDDYDVVVVEETMYPVRDDEEESKLDFAALLARIAEASVGSPSVASGGTSPSAATSARRSHAPPVSPLLAARSRRRSLDDVHGLSARLAQQLSVPAVKGGSLPGIHTSGRRLGSAGVQPTNSAPTPRPPPVPPSQASRDRTGRAAASAAAGSPGVAGAGAGAGASSGGEPATSGGSGVSTRSLGGSSILASPQSRHELTGAAATQGSLILSDVLTGSSFFDMAALADADTDAGAAPVDGASASSRSRSRSPRPQTGSVRQRPSAGLNGAHNGSSHADE